MQLDDAVRAFLQEKHFAVLATLNADGMPQQTVMWYDLDGDEILMNTAAGRVKERNLRRNAAASICVEDGYRYVTITVQFSINDDQTVAQADIMRLATRYSGAEQGAEQAKNQFSHEQRLTLRLSIDRVSTRL